MFWVWGSACRHTPAEVWGGRTGSSGALHVPSVAERSSPSQGMALSASQKGPKGGSQQKGELLTSPAQNALQGAGLAQTTFFSTSTDTGRGCRCPQNFSLLTYSTASLSHEIKHIKQCQALPSLLPVGGTLPVPGLLLQPAVLSNYLERTSKRQILLFLRQQGPQGACSPPACTAPWRLSKALVLCHPLQVPALLRLKRKNQLPHFPALQGQQLWLFTAKGFVSLSGIGNTGNPLVFRPFNPCWTPTRFVLSDTGEGEIWSAGHPGTIQVPGDISSISSPCCTSPPSTSSLFLCSSSAV